MKATLKASFKWSFWGFGLYVQEASEQETRLSNKGMIETRIIVEVDEKNSLVTIRTDTLHNYYFFISVTGFFVIIIWLIGNISFQLSDVILILGAELLILFFFSEFDKTTCMRKVVDVLKEFDEI